MPAFDETRKTPEFGIYSGCPCTIQLERGISTTDKNMPDSEFKKKVDDLIAEWKGICPEFVPGPRIGGGRYCKLSLKEGQSEEIIVI